MALQQKKNHTPPRILIADDHEVVREGLALLFNAGKEFKVVATAANGKELLDAIPKLKPDVIISDVKMPVMDGTEATRQIAAKYPHIPVIGYTGFGEEHLVMKILEAGAKGFLLKSSSRQEMVEAIEAVREGRNYFCKETTNLLARMIGKSKININHGSNGELFFNDHDKSIIQYICEEKSNKEIAALLDVNVRSVETSREKIFNKIGVKNTVGLVIYAIRHGIYKLSCLCIPMTGFDWVSNFTDLY